VAAGLKNRVSVKMDGLWWAFMLMGLVMDVSFEGASFRKLQFK
jgi:hypothetical protein